MKMTMTNQKSQNENECTGSSSIPAGFPMNLPRGTSIWPRDIGYRCYSLIEEVQELSFVRPFSPISTSDSQKLVEVKIYLWDLDLAECL